MTPALVLWATVAAGPFPPLPAGLERAVVTRINDGDTVEVRTGRRTERVRLIGIDCPELHDSPKLDRELRRGPLSRRQIVAMGTRARDVTAHALDGREVLLEDDVERHDRYGRRLAYVWLPDGTLWNGELLRAGWARLLTVPPNVRYADLFRRLAAAAREADRGLWSQGR